MRDIYSVRPILLYFVNLAITVAAQPKAWTVVAHSNTGILGSNRTQVTDVCTFILCVGSGLMTGWFLVQGVLPTL
jgi:hypothetical protein